MKFKRFLTCILAYSIMASAISFNSITTSAIHQDTATLPTDKITNLLSERMANVSDEEIPVIIWFQNVSNVELESRIYHEIGYNLDSLEVDYPTPLRRFN